MPLNQSAAKKATQTPQREGLLQSAVDAYLKKTLVPPSFHLRLNSGQARVRGGVIHLCPEGTADFVVFPDWFVGVMGVIWLELKKPGKDTTAKSRTLKQGEFAGKVKALGHSYYIVRSMDELQTLLDYFNTSSEKMDHRFGLNSSRKFNEQWRQYF